MNLLSTPRRSARLNSGHASMDININYLIYNIQYTISNSNEIILAKTEVGGISLQ